MAAEDALDTQPSALEYAILHDRLNHVLAARGRVTARRRREGRNEGAVEIYRQEEYVAKQLAHGVAEISQGRLMYRLNRSWL